MTSSKEKTDNDFLKVGTHDHKAEDAVKAATTGKRWAKGVKSELSFVWLCIKDRVIHVYEPD